MPAAVFDISEVDKLGAFVGKALEKVAARAIYAASLHVVQQITTTIIPGEPRSPIDRRVFAAGWRATPTKVGAIIENTVPYSDIIENGARAENIKIGRAMIDALAAWVQRKGLHLRGDGGKDDPRAIAWAVAQGMKKRGIFNGGKGLKILQKGLEHLEEFLAEEVRRELAREFR